MRVGEPWWQFFRTMRYYLPVQKFKCGDTPVAFFYYVLAPVVWIGRYKDVFPSKIAVVYDGFEKGFIAAGSTIVDFFQAFKLGGTFHYARIFCAEKKFRQGYVLSNAHGFVVYYFVMRVSVKKCTLQQKKDKKGVDTSERLAE